jgi:hypothetical protein
MLATAAPVVTNRLLLLPSGLLSLLGALWLRTLDLLCALRLRLALCLLGALRLRLALCLLGALRLRLALCLLGALRLRLALCRLGTLRLRLVLRRLRLFSSALLLLSFLCECRKGGSEKQKQNCCADNSIVFHRCCLQLISHLPLTGYSRHPRYTVYAQGCQYCTAHV